MARAARAGRPSFARVRQEIEETERNPRVKGVHAQVWRRHRYRLFKQATNYAAAAKAYRTAKQVACWEVARVYDVESSTVSHWESGGYFGWDDLELKRYQREIDRIARG